MGGVVNAGILVVFLGLIALLAALLVVGLHRIS